MDFFTRINAVLDREQPDQVAFAPYDGLMPRGEFSRELRNRGMGLLVRRDSVTEETPNVRTESFEMGTLSLLSTTRRLGGNFHTQSQTYPAHQ